jgi:predicted ArsR family transcriptional regulator
MSAAPTRVERWAYALAERAEHDARARAVLNAMVNVAFKAIAVERGRGGRRLLDLARTTSIRWGRWRAQRMRARLGVDVNDMSDMGRVQDWEDRVFGVTGHWTERGRTRAVKCETACPFARAASSAPEICTDVVHALETSTFQQLNPRYRLLPLERLLSKGSTACEFVHVLEDVAPAPTR